MSTNILSTLRELASQAREIVHADDENADADTFDPQTETVSVELNIKAWNLIKELAGHASEVTMTDILAEHENHRVHVGGAWTTDVVTVDTVNTTPEQLDARFGRYAVYCLRCKTSLSQQWL